MIAIPKVLILLSAYNGEKYLREQLDSIFEQESGSLEIHMLVRDDGSTDGTVQFLRDESEKHNITIIEGENIKPAQSFLALINQADEGYDAYAFADQDDIWQDGKLESALKALKSNTGTPALWYSNIAYLKDGESEPADICPIEKARSLGVICETFATTNGCTMVFNEALLKVLQSCESGQVDMHDSFTNAMCVAAGGKVIKDSTPYVLYRIHNEQVLGTGDFSTSATFKRFLNPNRLRSKTVETMLTSPLITDENRAYLEKFANYKKLSNKIKLLSSPAPEGLSKKQHLKFISQIITNTY